MSTYNPCMTAPDRSPCFALASKTGWRPWLIVWAILFAVQVVLLSHNAALDTAAWRATRWLVGDQDAYHWAAYKAQHGDDPHAPFYARIDPPFTTVKNGQPVAGFYKRTESLWRLLRDLGEPSLTLVLMVLVWVYDRRGWKAAVLLFAGSGLAGGLGALVRALSGRFRPVATEGLNHWHAWRGFHEGTDLSWPSGHATLAFATAAVLSYLSPRGKWLFFTIALGCALSRVVMQAHFYSDVILGSALGWTVGWFTTLCLDRQNGSITARSSRLNVS